MKTSAVSILFLGLVLCFKPQLEAKKNTVSDPEAARVITDTFGPGPTGAFRAQNGMVTSSSQYATLAGLETLRSGANAYDAIAVMQFVLTATEPYASGLGGGLFAVAYDAESGEVITLDGRESAPAAADANWFADSKGRIAPFSKRINGGRAVGVPGTLAAIAYLLEAHGTLSLKEAVVPAIRIAENGFYVTEPFARNLAAHWDRLSQFPKTRALFAGPDGGPLVAGDLFRNPQLAATLRLIGEQGINVFYEGEIAADIINSVNNSEVNQGQMTAADLKGYRPQLREPIVSTYKDFTIYGMDMPSSGGATIALILNMLEVIDVDLSETWALPQLNAVITAQNLAFADRNAYMGDADFAQVPTAELIAKPYAEKRAALFNASTANAKPFAPGLPQEFTQQNGTSRKESPTTTHFTVVDSARNVLSVTSTIEQHFGSGLLAGERGFLLNNELTDFNRDALNDEGELHPNAIQGGKRPRSSMSPTIVMRDDRPYIALGSPGGSRIIGVTLNVLLNLIERDMQLQAAINAPRIISRNGDPELESPLYRDAAILDGLQALGYDVNDAGAAGSVQAIIINRDGWLEGAADPRREGLALGY